MSAHVDSSVKINLERGEGALADEVFGGLSQRSQSPQFTSVVKVSRGAKLVFMSTDQSLQPAPPEQEIQEAHVGQKLCLNFTKRYGCREHLVIP